MADAHAEHHMSYMAVFWWLAVLTVIEIAVIFLPIPKVAVAVLLVALASSKAVLVAFYFMHLKFEAKTLGYIALTPALIGVLLLLVLLPDHWGWTHRTAAEKKIEAPKH